MQRPGPRSADAVQVGQQRKKEILLQKERRNQEIMEDDEYQEVGDPQDSANIKEAEVGFRFLLALKLMG